MNVSQDGPPSEPADKLGQNAPDDILINTYSERQIDLLGDMWTSPGRIALFHRDNRADQIRCWAFRSRLAFLFWRKQQPIFTLHERAMKNQQGQRPKGEVTATRAKGRGRIQSEQNPGISLSKTRRFGARRERLRISN